MNSLHWSTINIRSLHWSTINVYSLHWSTTNIHSLINNQFLFITLINNQKIIYYIDKIDFTIPSLFITRTLIGPNEISKFNKFRYLSELLVAWVHKSTECAKGHVKQAGWPNKPSDNIRTYKGMNFWQHFILISVLLKILTKQFKSAAMDMEL